MGAAEHDVGDYAAGHHQHDGGHLCLQMPQIAPQLVVQCSHGLPVQIARFALMSVALDAGHAAVADVDHSIRNGGDIGVVGDHHGGGTQFAIDAADRLQHHNTGSYI